MRAVVSGALRQSESSICGVELTPFKAIHKRLLVASCVRVSYYQASQRQYLTIRAERKDLQRPVVACQEGLMVTV